MKEGVELWSVLLEVRAEALLLGGALLNQVLPQANVAAKFESRGVLHTKPAQQKSLVDELKGGLRYTKGEPTIVALTVLGGLTTFLGLPLLTFLPVFAKDIFHGDINRFSHMMAFSGAGAVCGALIVAWLGRFKHMGRTLLMTQVAFGALILRMQDIVFGAPKGPKDPVKASYLPLFIHLALVLVAGLWLPGEVVRWFRAVATLLG